MREHNDWRLQGEHAYMNTITLQWKNYTRYSDNWEEDHCEFCWCQFSDTCEPHSLHEGYATGNNFHWVCKDCFDDFHEIFDWQIIDSVG